MSLRRISALLVLALLGSAAAEKPGRRTGAAGLVMMLQSGRPRIALQNASRQLESDPDNREVLTALGIAEARSGYFADALGTLSLCEGTALYNDLGLEAHANALRAQGHGEAAAALRLERAVSPMPELQELRLWLYAADDLLAAGDPHGAMEKNLVGMSIFPAAGLLLAQHAEILLALGDTEGADFWLWRAEHAGEPQRWLIVEGHRRLSLGDLSGAGALADRYTSTRQPSARLAALRAEVLRQRGQLEAARRFLTIGAWALTEDPDVQVVRLRILRDLGEEAAAARLVARLGALYPDNPAVQAAITAPAR